MKRILVVGITGAGKSTLARALAGALEIPFHEMDALAFTGPGWQENRHLLEDVARISAQPSWIFDSAARTLRRRRIFGGNVETLASWFRADHPAWRAWSQYAGRGAEIAARCASPGFAPLTVIRLTTPRAVSSVTPDPAETGEKIRPVIVSTVKFTVQLIESRIIYCTMPV